MVRNLIKSRTTNTAFVDASFNLHWDSKGHTGFAIFPDSTSAAVLVKSIKHKTIADSSTEAELIALHESLKIYLGSPTSISNLVMTYGLLKFFKTILAPSLSRPRSLLTFAVDLNS